MATPLPDNDAAFSLEEAARATRGEASGAAAAATHVVTDSRRVRQGSLFVALRGERFDGSAFAADAARAGAAIVVTDRAEAARCALDAGGAAVLVADALGALGDLAAFHRERWGALGGRRLVAVAGSAGKTTTTRALACVLAAELGERVHATPGNLNNRVGAPMTALALRHGHEVCVMELGTNEPGEVAALTAIARPDVGLLTLIGLEHTEGLGTLEAIEDEEGALLRALPASGHALGNGDDARVARQLGLSPAAKTTWGFAAGCDVQIASYEPLGTEGSRVRLALRDEAPVELVVPLLGRAGALAAAAVFAGARFGLGLHLSRERLEEGLGVAARSAEGRLVPRRFADGTVLLDDSYNANPPSMVSSIGLAREVAEREQLPLVLVLGEMRELGAVSVAEHEALADAVVEARPARVLCIGGDARHLHGALARADQQSAFYTGSADAALEASALVGAVVLVKGSRGVRTELVAQAVAKATGGEGA